MMKVFISPSIKIMDIYIWQTAEGHKYIILYFIIVNLIGVGIMALDKYKAEKGYWRIPENTLFVVAILGGAIRNFIWNV